MSKIPIWPGSSSFNSVEQPTPFGFYDDDNDLDATNELNWNIVTDYNFFSQVWNKTIGGTIPFIFTPDRSNTSPDNFVIARIRNDSLDAKRVAPNLYEISLIIEETW